MELFETLAVMGQEELLLASDPSCGYRGIIAVHSTALGPALGGTRFWQYDSDDAAIIDALRLSRGMTYKNAVANLDLGGGKSVIIGDNRTASREAIFRAHGRAVESLGGRYITAEDVGMSVNDMIEVARHTRYVAGLPVEAGEVGGDPSPHTALGVFLGLKAAVRRALGRDSVAGLHIALQGAGSVAKGVAMHACAEGAKLSIADVDAEKASKLAEATGGTVVDPDEILTLDADVLSPNALGAILSAETIPTLKVPVVAGGANNQLAVPEDGTRLVERGILYAPDYVINAGGIINVTTEYLGDGDASLVKRRIEAIPERLEQIWAESDTSGRDPQAVADAMAQRLIGRA